MTVSEFEGNRAQEALREQLKKITDNVNQDEPEIDTAALEETSDKKLAKAGMAKEIIPESGDFVKTKEWMLEYLTQQIHELSQREGGIENNASSLLVFSFDVRGLKTFNDAFGTSTGNEYLQEFANASEEVIIPLLQRTLKKIQQKEASSVSPITRTGGDEFAFSMTAAEGFDWNMEVTPEEWKKIEPKIYEILSRETRPGDASNKLKNVFAEIAERKLISLKVSGDDGQEGAIISNAELEEKMKKKAPEGFKWPLLSAVAADTASDIYNPEHRKYAKKIKPETPTKNFAAELMALSEDKMERRKNNQMDFFRQLGGEQINYLLYCLTRSEETRKLEEGWQKATTRGEHLRQYAQGEINMTKQEAQALFRMAKRFRKKAASEVKKNSKLSADNAKLRKEIELLKQRLKIQET